MGLSLPLECISEIYDFQDIFCPNECWAPPPQTEYFKQIPAFARGYELKLLNLSFIGSLYKIKQKSWLYYASHFFLKKKKSLVFSYYNKGIFSISIAISIVQRNPILERVKFKTQTYVLRLSFFRKKCWCQFFKLWRLCTYVLEYVFLNILKFTLEEYEFSMNFYILK